MSSGTWLKVFDFPQVGPPDPFNRGLYFQVTFLIWVLDQLLLAKLVPSPNMISNPREESPNMGPIMECEKTVLGDLPNYLYILLVVCFIVHHEEYSVFPGAGLGAVKYYMVLTQARLLSFD